MAVQARVAARRAATQVGRVVEVLVEGSRGRRSTGRTRTQAPEIDGIITLDGPATAGVLVAARVTSAETYDLRGDILQIQVDTPSGGA